MWSSAGGTWKGLCGALKATQMNQGSGSERMARVARTIAAANGAADTVTVVAGMAEELPGLPSAKEKKQLLELTLKEDGSGFEVEGELKELADSVQERFEEGKNWWERMTSFADGIGEGDAEKVFGAVKSLAQWQELTQNDRGSTISADMDLKRILAQAERYLGMAAGGT